MVAPDRPSASRCHLRRFRVSGRPPMAACHSRARTRRAHVSGRGPTTRLVPALTIYHPVNRRHKRRRQPGRVPQAERDPPFRPRSPIRWPPACKASRQVAAPDPHAKAPLRGNPSGTADRGNEPNQGADAHRHQVTSGAASQCCTTAQTESGGCPRTCCTPFHPCPLCRLYLQDVPDVHVGPVHRDIHPLIAAGIQQVAGDPRVK